MKVLHKSHQLLVLDPVALGGQDYKLFRDGTTFSAGPNWQDISTPNLQNLFLSSTYFDLAGLAVEDETLFIEAATVQSAGARTMVSGGAGDQYTVWDVMTSIPVDWTALDDTWYYNGLGFPATKLNFEHVLYQRKQTWALTSDNDALVPTLIDEDQSGSLMSTASDRIYSYRLVALAVFSGTPGPPPGGLLYVTIPPARHVIQATTKKEPDFEYLMRLKRSYDLQNEPDVDKS